MEFSILSRANETKEKAKSLNAYFDTVQVKVYDLHLYLVDGNESIAAEKLKAVTYFYQLMKCRFLLLLLVLQMLRLSVSAQGEGNLFDSLYLAISNTKSYDQQTQATVERIRNGFGPVQGQSLTAQYLYNAQLYEVYKVYRFDSAFIYAKETGEIAAQLNNPIKITESKIRLLFVLLSAGLYKECEEVIRSINIDGTPDSLKADYYLLQGRYHYDLVDYNSDKFYTPTYYQQANAYLDSALTLFPPNSFESIYYDGLQKMKRDNLEAAYTSFQTLTQHQNLTEHQVALLFSTLSFIYESRGEIDSAISVQTKAAIADILSSTKETYAILNLSQLLFKKGDFKNASAFIEKAVDDASFYGARQRKVQVSSIMPIIQSSNLNYIENQRRLWIIYAVVVTFILILFLFLAYIIYKQYKKLNHSRQLISEANNKLNNTNHQLTESNSKLTEAIGKLEEVNSKLKEANKIKEEYVGYFFTAYSSFFHRIERFKEIMEKKIHSGRLEDVRFTLNSINIKREQEEILRNFDRAFMKLFPDFVKEFNALLHEEDQIVLPENELLTTELRIYALIRLGIRENDKIAEILEYSVKSIYAYKTRIRNKAKFSKEDFEGRVMQIKSV